MKKTRAVSTAGQDARDFLTLKRRKEGMKVKRNKLLEVGPLRTVLCFRSIIVILLLVLL